MVSIEHYVVIGLALLLLSAWVARSYVPYTEGHIVIIMYNKTFFSALIGVRGLTVTRRSGEVVDTAHTHHGMLWGLIPGYIYPWPLFHVKKGNPVTTSNIHTDPHGNRSIQVETKYQTAIPYQEAHYFHFSQLETGIDFEKEDPQLGVEYADIKLFLAGRFVITNINDYFFKEPASDPYKSKTQIIRPLVRSMVAQTTYQTLLTQRDTQAEFLIGNERPMSDLVNEKLGTLKLGSKSLTITIDDVELGEGSKILKEKLRKRTASRLDIDIEKYLAQAAIEKLRSDKEALRLIEDLWKNIAQTANVNETKKWEMIRASKLNQYFEGTGVSFEKISLQQILSLIKFVLKK